MVFKQKILKEEIIKLVIYISCIIIPFFAIFALVIINKDNRELFIMFIIKAYSITTKGSPYSTGSPLSTKILTTLPLL